MAPPLPAQLLAFTEASDFGGSVFVTDRTLAVEKIRARLSDVLRVRIVNATTGAVVASREIFVPDRLLTRQERDGVALAADASTACSPLRVDSLAGFNPNRVVVAIILCRGTGEDGSTREDAFQQQLRLLGVNLKSIALFASVPFHVAVIAESSATFEDIVALTRSWPPSLCAKVSFSEAQQIDSATTGPGPSRIGA